MLRTILLGLCWSSVSAVGVEQAGDPKAGDPKAGDTEAGYVALFDGRTLDGWVGDAVKHFRVEQGCLICAPGCQGKLLTEREYADFVLQFEFKLTPNANNGLAIRAPLEGDAAFAGIELQILDNSAAMYRELEDYQFHGSAYGVAAAKRGALKPVGAWNSQQVACQGRQLQVTLNGKTILEVDLDEAAPQGKTLDGKKHPGLKRTQGHVGFLCHGDEVAFRNIRIKQLEADVTK